MISEHDIVDIRTGAVRTEGIYSVGYRRVGRTGRYAPRIHVAIAVRTGPLGINWTGIPIHTKPMARELGERLCSNGDRVTLRNVLTMQAGRGPRPGPSPTHTASHSTPFRWSSRPAQISDLSSGNRQPPRQIMLYIPLPDF